uniref:Uncharacterized protein n=1 Tax=Romanomermis culicivorax TaxID=13658 RepID=A0A915HI68_ROMCU
MSVADSVGISSVSVPDFTNPESRSVFVAPKIVLSKRMLGNEDLLGTVIQDALGVVLDGRLRNLETQLTRKVENAE